MRTGCSASTWRTTAFCPATSGVFRSVAFRDTQLHRPGRVKVELEFKDGSVEGVWIIGQAVSIFETEILL